MELYIDYNGCRHGIGDTIKHKNKEWRIQSIKHGEGSFGGSGSASASIVRSVNLGLFRLPFEKTRVYGHASFLGKKDYVCTQPDYFELKDMPTCADIHQEHIRKS